MADYFATCARGLEAALVAELTQLGADNVRPGRGGVHFAGDTATLYRASLWLRTAVRVLRPVFEGPVHSPDELYDAVRTILWSDYMTADHTLAVDCNVRDSAITHSQYASRRVKDAICDQFREREGRRPSVDTETPMIGLNLHIGRNHAILSLDTSWNSLHKRGYRPVLNRAPLNEALAVGLLFATGWDGQVPLVDFMCGSGTFPIEAAWIATNHAPGLMRKWFSFMGWPDFDRELWNAMREEARAKQKAALPAPICGSDIRRDAIDFATNNAKAAGVANLVRFDRLELKIARPPVGPPGVLICNPPYGERIGEEEELVGLYREMGEVAAAHWSGWRFFVFTGNDYLAKQIGLKVVRQTQFFNGALPCKLWEFRTDSR